MELDEENDQVMKEVVLGNRRGVASLGWGKGRIKWAVLGGLSSTEGCRQDKAVGLPHPAHLKETERSWDRRRQLGARAQPPRSLVVFISKGPRKLVLLFLFLKILFLYM